MLAADCDDDDDDNCGILVVVPSRVLRVEQ